MEKIKLKFFERTKPIYLITSSVILVLGLGYIDFLTGEELSFSIFYFIPIIVVSWFFGKRAGVAISFVSAITWLAAEVSTGKIYSSYIILVWNTTMRLLIFLIITYLLALLKTNIVKVYELRNKRQKEKAIIETVQKMVLIMAEYITANNSEILDWVERRKNSGHQVSEKLENASRSIGQSLKALTQVCFIENKMNKQEKNNPDKYLDALKAKLDELISEYKKEPDDDE